MLIKIVLNNETNILLIQLTEQCSYAIWSLDGCDFSEHGMDGSSYPRVLQLSEDGIKIAVSSIIHSSSKFKGKAQVYQKAVNCNLMVVGKCAEMLNRLYVVLKLESNNQCLRNTFAF